MLWSSKSSFLPKILTHLSNWLNMLTLLWRSFWLRTKLYIYIYIYIYIYVCIQLSEGCGEVWRVKMSRFACGSGLFPLTVSHLFKAESQFPGERVWSRWRGKDIVVCELFFILMYCVYMCICTYTHVHVIHVSMYVCIVCNVYNACL